MALLLSIPPAVWALLGALFGGVGLKIVEKFLNRSVEARATRQDYRLEIKELQDRLDKVESEVDTWRQRFYEAEVKIARLKIQVIQLGGIVEDT